MARLISHRFYIELSNEAIPVTDLKDLFEKAVAIEPGTKASFILEKHEYERNEVVVHHVIEMVIED
jgi:hypothetical protein